MAITAFPLSWPPQFPRSKARENGKFKTSLAGALKNVQTSLGLFAKDSGKKLDGLIISSNVTLGAHKPEDTGVAVWFSWDGLQVCIAVDRYNSIEGNLQAIHHIVEARRVELRHGTLALVRATFQGFLALPSAIRRDWWVVLGVSRDASPTAIKEAYRKKSYANHPDKGGDANTMAEINLAFQEATR
jgi:hypothetical protein